MLNKENWNEAFEILSNNSDLNDKYAWGGIFRFEGLTMEGVSQLYNKEMLDPEEAQNSSPTVEEMINFIKDNKFENKLNFHGYIVVPERNDVRISFEGVQNKKGATFSKRDLDKIEEMFINSDELDLNQTEVWVWYD